VTHSPKEIDVDLGETVDPDALVSQIEAALSGGDGVLWLTDRRGRRVGVPADKVAYVEIGADSGDRRVGFSGP